MESNEVISWLIDLPDACELQNLELPHNDPGKDDIPPHIMPTPPVSLSPKKRRLDSDANADDGRGEPASAASRQPIAPLALRPFGSQGKPQASASRSSSRLDSETSESKARSTSPVKRLITLQLLAKPVVFVKASKDLFAQIPTDAHSLLSGVRRATGVNKSAFIPAAARDIIGRELPDGQEWQNQWFFQSDDAQGTPELALAETQFKALLGISTDAESSMRLGRNELAWNCLVHCPLLQLATRSFSRGGVICEPVVSAGIATHWLPEMASKPMTAASKEAVASGKMVDFVLALGLEDPRPRDQELADGILEVIKDQPDESLSINHTLYHPLAKSPIGVNIETKIGAVPTEGTLQLGIWTAAWHRRMRDLGYMDQLITLPLIICHGPGWSLYFACDRGHKIEIVGPLLLGNTDSMESLYPLFAALVELCKWVEGTLRNWWITQLGGDPTNF